MSHPRLKTLLGALLLQAAPAMAQTIVGPIDAPSNSHYVPTEIAVSGGEARLVDAAFGHRTNERLLASPPARIRV